MQVIKGAAVGRTLQLGRQDTEARKGRAVNSNWLYGDNFGALACEDLDGDQRCTL